MYICIILFINNIHFNKKKFFIFPNKFTLYAILYLFTKTLIVCSKMDLRINAVK